MGRCLICSGPAFPAAHRPPSPAASSRSARPACPATAHGPRRCAALWSSRTLRPLAPPRLLFFH
eukprot:5134431-Heterocapsa_arctica.AAC.1